MKRIAIALALCATMATPALAQSYDPDLGPAGNVRPGPFAYGYPGYGHWGGHYAYRGRYYGYYAPRRHWGFDAYARVPPGGWYRY